MCKDAHVFKLAARFFIYTCVPALRVAEKRSFEAHMRKSLKYPFVAGVAEGGTFRPGHPNAADPRPAGSEPRNEGGRGRVSGRERMGPGLLTPAAETAEHAAPDSAELVHSLGETAARRWDAPDSMSRLRFSADSSLPPCVTPAADGWSTPARCGVGPCRSSLLVV